MDVGSPMAAEVHLFIPAHLHAQSRWILSHGDVGALRSGLPGVGRNCSTVIFTNSERWVNVEQWREEGERI